MEQLTMIDLVRVECFWGARTVDPCLHVVEAIDPQEAHDLMEEHYQGKHKAAIDRLVGLLR